MPRNHCQTLEDKLNLLMTCIKHSSSRLVIDFDKVKDEIDGIDTKRTAYYRYLRLMKEYGMSPNGELYKGGAPSGKGTGPKKAASSNAEAAASKDDGGRKRKRASAVAEDNGKNAAAKPIKRARKGVDETNQGKTGSEKGEASQAQLEDDHDASSDISSVTRDLLADYEEEEDMDPEEMAKAALEYDEEAMSDFNVSSDDNADIEDDLNFKDWVNEEDEDAENDDDDDDDGRVNLGSEQDDSIFD